MASQAGKTTVKALLMRGKIYLKYSMEKRKIKFLKIELFKK